MDQVPAHRLDQADRKVPCHEETGLQDLSRQLQALQHWGRSLQPHYRTVHDVVEQAGHGGLLHSCLDSLIDLTCLKPFLRARLWNHYAVPKSQGVEAYFDYIAAPGDNSAALVHVLVPSASLPRKQDRHQYGVGEDPAGTAGRHRSSVGWQPEHCGWGRSCSLNGENHVNGVLVRVSILEQGRIGRRLTIFMVRSAWAHRDWYRVTSVSWLIIFSTLDQIVNGPVNLYVMSDKSEHKSPDGRTLELDCERIAVFSLRRATSTCRTLNVCFCPILTGLRT